MIVEREQEIRNFITEEYWTIEADLAKQREEKGNFRAKFVGLADKKQPLAIHNEEEASQITEALRTAEYAVAKVSKKSKLRQPQPPFITSTLQQEAWRKLRFTSKRTMAVAQQLYEGLPLGNEGSVGLITYMRTDSTAVAETAIQETREYIGAKFGGEFLPRQPRKFAKKAKGAQEAHEAIRPTRSSREPASLRAYLSADQSKLYDLIWKRMVSSQMAAANFDNTTVDIVAKKGQTYLLRSAGSVLRFPGFLSLYSEGMDEVEEGDEAKQTLPKLSEGEALLLRDLFPEQRFTQPPPRYSEATLVKAMEENGIGRPSTYAPTIATLFQRGYVERREGRFHPLELGITVDEAMVKHFPDIVDVSFTAQMEGSLDKIAQGKLKWPKVIQDFYGPFEQALDKASVNMESLKEAPQPTDEVCPECGKPMVIRSGRFGKFLACTGFPKCKTTQRMTPGNGEGRATSAKKQSVAEPTEEACPKCGRPMVMRSGRFGKFLACTGFPKCRTTKKIAAGKKSDESSEAANTKPTPRKRGGKKK
jgi:DNA topoisomerase-1